MQIITVAQVYSLFFANLNLIIRDLGVLFGDKIDKIIDKISLYDNFVKPRRRPDYRAATSIL